MLVVTYWCDSDPKRTPDDFDEIAHVRIKSVTEFPTLIKARPPHTTMISVEHSSPRKLKSGKTSIFFREIWRGDRAKHVCPTCGRRSR